MTTDELNRDLIEILLQHREYELETEEALKQLTLLASKVAEEERKRAVEILDSFIDEVLSNNGASLEDLLNRIKGK